MPVDRLHLQIFHQGGNHLLWLAPANDQIAAQGSQRLPQIGQTFEQKPGPVSPGFGKAKLGLPELSGIQAIDRHHGRPGGQGIPERVMIVKTQIVTEPEENRHEAR
jgi:hypothetical protein